MNHGELRPYQQGALAASRSDWLAGTRRQVLVQATGTGKTPVLASIKAHHGIQGRALVLVHREELAEQAANQFRRWNPTYRVGIEMGGHHCHPDDDVVIAGVQTLGTSVSKRLDQFSPERFKLLIIDEVHLAIANSYGRIIEHLGFGTEKVAPDRLMFGCTATPNRTDGQGLIKYFDKVVYELGIRQAIEEGWLCDLKGIKVETKVDISSIHTKLGDFDQSELTKAINTTSRNDAIVRAWLDNAADRRTIVFAVDIQHAKDLAEAFKRYGVAAEAVWGSDPDRADKLRYHKAGALQVLVNVQILTVGYDDPGIQAIVLARPTKSALLYQQSIGRGTRLQEGIANLKEAQAAGVQITKKDCLILDIADTVGRHSLVSLPSLFGVGERVNLKGVSVVQVAQSIEQARAEHPSIDFSKLEDATKIDTYIREVNIFKVEYAPEVVRNSTMQWIKVAEGHYVLIINKTDSITVKQDTIGKWGVSGKVFLNTVHEECIPDMKMAFDLAESMVKLYADKLVTLLRRAAKWREDMASPAQLKLISRFGLKPYQGMTKGDAAKIITEQIYRRSQKRATA